MYKKAARLKLRFDTPKGALSVEQLFDLTMTELSSLIKKTNAIVKKEKSAAEDDDLAFLEGKDNVESLNSLRFGILKDIYLTKKQERDDAAIDLDKKQKDNELQRSFRRKRMKH